METPFEPVSGSGDAAANGANGASAASADSANSASAASADGDDSNADAAVGLQQLTLTFPAAADVTQLHFVLRSADAGMWYKDGNSNFTVPVAPRGGKGGEAGDDGGAIDDALVQAIVDSENTDAWTLMHRFNRAADLLEEARFCSTVSTSICVYRIWMCAKGVCNAFAAYRSAHSANSVCCSQL